MCIICVQPQGKLVSKEVLSRCWDNNRDGGGFAYTDGKQVFTHKELTSFEKYYEAFQIAMNLYPNTAVVHHFRISTHGKINEDNCHPFYVNSKLAFAHNGIISNATYSNDFSDTYMFNDEILRELPNGFLAQRVYRELIQSYIGYGSKLAFIDNKSVCTIVNEKAGVWDEGIWYSNSGYKAYSYHDYGGQRVYTKAPVKAPKTSSKAAKKGLLPFNGSSFEQPKDKKVIYNANDFTIGAQKICDIDWDKRLKTDSLDSSERYIPKYDKGYTQHCVVCDEKLTSYTEKSTCVCGKCQEEFNCGSKVY